LAREDIKARAVILRSVDYGERDRILTLLVEGQGKCSAIAKGAKNSKKRFAGLDLFRVLQVSYLAPAAEKMAVLGECAVTEDYHDIEGSFEKMAVASYATELVREIIREDEGGQEIFELLVGYYQQLHAAEDAVARLEADLHAFSLMLLRAAGFAPSLSQCCRTGRPVSESRAWRFALTGEGALHPDARREGERTVETSREVLEALESLSYGYPLAASDVPEVSILRRIRPLMLEMFKVLLGKEPRSTQYLKMVLP
jgi:DNA repair protein RecO (recombination protein O)